MFKTSTEDGKSVNRIPSSLALRPHLTWSKITSSKQSFRFKPSGHLFETAGPSLFGDSRVLAWLQGYLNSSISESALSFMSPTLNCNPNEIASLPIIYCGESCDAVVGHVAQLRLTSQVDWDSLETSWDFKRHPLLWAILYAFECCPLHYCLAVLCGILRFLVPRSAFGQ